MYRVDLFDTSSDDSILAEQWRRLCSCAYVTLTLELGLCSWATPLNDFHLQSHKLFYLTLWLQSETILFTMINEVQLLHVIVCILFAFCIISSVTLSDTQALKKFSEEE